jgi:hypothetical protein
VASCPRRPQIWLAVLFAVLTAVTTLNSTGVPLLQFLIDPFRTAITQQDLLEALPGTLAFWFLLGEWCCLFQSAQPPPALLAGLPCLGGPARLLSALC